MFHEFGHALHGMFADTKYPTLSGTAVPRDFVEFPSQFNEHWASYPAVFNHYAKHYKTGAPMPAELAAKIKKSATFNQGYTLTETAGGRRTRHAVAHAAGRRTAAESGHVRNRRRWRRRTSRSATCRRAIAPATSRTSGAATTPPATTPICGREMLDDDAFQWFEDHGGLTRANGDRFRQMVLSRGNTEDLAKMYKAWLGAEPSIEPMLKYRGIAEPVSK